MTYDDPQISQRMKAAGKEHLLTLVNYHDAGHLIEPPYSPHFRVTSFRKNGRSYDDELQCKNILCRSSLRYQWNLQPYFLSFYHVLFLL